MFLSAKAEYACLAMIELAIQHGDPKPVPLGDVAERHGIPQRFLVQILLQLKGAGLVVSTRGASGGYHLSRRPDQITVADILAVFESSDAPKDRGTTASSASNALQMIWKRLSTVREEILAITRLADLVPNPGGSDYVI